ncbi:dTMP kinase [Candidatus Peregrinibacteria bacterium]|nr:dTMP kinase [Candidatus Peregrinibacteria bacterium]
MFLVFEGLDGSGSTTQAKLLAEKLRALGKKVIHTSEPTDNAAGKLIRDALQGKWKISPEGLQLLFCADRAHHLEQEILPALNSDNIVICDRYIWSTLAYGSLNTDSKWLQELNKHFLKPDFTFLLQVPPKICLERIHKRGLPNELFEEEQKLKKVWETYEELVIFEKNSIALDGERKEEEILDEALAILRKKFPDEFSG